MPSPANACRQRCTSLRPDRRPVIHARGRRHDGHLGERILYPCEPRLAADSAVESISIAYPAIASSFRGSTWWIVWFVILSIVIALTFKPLLEVEL